MKTYSILLHGGAGARAGADYTETEQHLSVLAAQAEKQIQGGRSALDVVESAVNAMEASGLYVAGRGSAPNSAGYVELDASIMDGAGSRAGSVTCLRDAVYPVSVARGVMEKTRHVMLAGTSCSPAPGHRISRVNSVTKWLNHRTTTIDCRSVSARTRS